MSVRLLLSCGESSGDLYAGQLTRELLARRPSAVVEGLGGPHLAAAGGRLLADYRQIAARGLVEPLRKMPRLLATLSHLVNAARQHRPDVLVLIDNWGFNSQLAQRIKRLGVPIVYYISPQIWAWRPGRLQRMRKLADRVLVIFPFEEKIYRDGGVPVEFVGHPLVDLARPARSRDTLLGDLGFSADAPVVALLPGSGPGEVRLILPGLLAAADRIRARLPTAQFIVAKAPQLDVSLFAEVESRARIVDGETDSVLAAADVALTASGTATVQAALHDTPMVVVYRLSELDYQLGRRFVHLDTFAMVNLIAGEKLVPELIQQAFTPDAVAAEAISMLTDADRAARIRAGLARVRASLAGSGASGRAADAILRIAEGHPHSHSNPVAADPKVGSRHH